MTAYPIEPNVEFLSRAITPQCKKAWRKLFAVMRKANVTPQWGDIALWVTHADSALFRLRMRSSDEDDEDPEWESPPFVYFLTNGLCEALNDAGSPSKEKPIKTEFYEWVNAAILQSFESAPIQKLYRAYNPDDEPFSIFVSKHERSFSESSFTVLWTNRRGPKPRSVKEKQAKARKGKRYKAVRKKSPAKLRAEGRTKAVDKTSVKNSKQAKKKRKTTGK